MKTPTLLGFHPLAVAVIYVSGSPLSGSLTLADEILESLGITPPSLPATSRSFQTAKPSPSAS